MRSYYYAKVTHIDRCVDPVIDALVRNRKLDDTWIIYIPD